MPIDEIWSCFESYVHLYSLIEVVSIGIFANPLQNVAESPLWADVQKLVCCIYKAPAANEDTRHSIQSSLAALIFLLMHRVCQLLCK